MLTEKSSSLLALILLHSKKLEAVFEKPKQAVSLPLTTQNEIASSFYLTSYIGGDCLEILRRSTSLKKVSCSLSVKERKKEVMHQDSYQEKHSHVNTITVVIQISTGMPLFLSSFFYANEEIFPGFVFLCNYSCVVVVG